MTAVVMVVGATVVVFAALGPAVVAVVCSPTAAVVEVALTVAVRVALPVVVGVAVAVAVVIVVVGVAVVAGSAVVVAHVPHVAGHVCFAFLPRKFVSSQSLDSMVMPHSGGSPIPLQSLVVVVAVAVVVVADVVVAVVVEKHAAHVVGQAR